MRICPRGCWGRWLILTSVVGVGLTNAGEGEFTQHTDHSVWRREQASLLAHVEEAEPRLQSLLHLVAIPSSNGTQPLKLVSALKGLAADEALPLPARERVLYEFAVALRPYPMTVEGRQALEYLSQYQSRVYVVDEASRGSLNLPLYRVAGAARGTLTVWARRESSDAASARINQEGMEFFSLSKLDSAVQRPMDVIGLRDALSKVPLENLQAYQDVFRLQRPLDPAMAPVAAILAERLHDVALCVEVLQYGDTLTARRLLERIREFFTPPQAFSLLDKATKRQPLASLAISEMGKLVPEVPQALETLFNALADPALGGSAAAALAALSDPSVIDKIEGLLETTTDKRLQARAVLTLQLDGSAPARLALDRFAASPKAPKQIRREVTKWLER
jgi:hypothetical protein